MGVTTVPTIAITDQLAAQVDEVFAKANHDDTPGAALAVVKSGKVIFERYYGSADLEHGVPVSAETMFDIASTSKQFTAAALVLLARRGDISLEDEVQTYIPELPFYETPMTLRHLIHHTSGIRDYLGVDSLLGARRGEFRNVLDILDITARQTTLNFPPGQKHSYCNTGYVLMGVIVTRVTGQSFPSFIRENILGPLGMTRSFFRDDPTAIVPGLVRGYAFNDSSYIKTLEGLDDVPGDGGLVSNVRELAIWDRNYIEEKVGGPGFTEQMEQVGTPEGSEEHYAFGLAVGEHHGRRTVAHGGALYGFAGEFLRFPDEQLTVIVQANAGGFDSSGIARKVADVFLDGSQVAVAGKGGARADEPAPTVGDPTPDSGLLGMYQHEESGSAFDVVLDGGQLVLLIRDIKIPLRRKHGDRFITEHPVYSLDMEFVLDADTRVLRLFHAGEVLMNLERVSPPDPATLDLGALAGNYFSPELDVSYEIRRDGDELHLWRRHAGRDVLRPMSRSEFASSFGRITFERTGDGPAAALVADTSRANGVRFERRPG